MRSVRLTTGEKMKSVMGTHRLEEDAGVEPGQRLSALAQTGSSTLPVHSDVQAWLARGVAVAQPARAEGIEPDPCSGARLAAFTHLCIRVKSFPARRTMSSIKLRLASAIMEVEPKRVGSARRTNSSACRIAAPRMFIQSSRKAPNESGPITLLVIKSLVRRRRYACVYPIFSDKR